MEKHFEATQSRVDAAKREGNIARSQEAGAVAAFAGGIAGLLLVLESLANAARTAVEAAPAGTDPSACFEICGLMLVPMAAAATASVAMSLL
ncbi:MAG: EscU/YscU/HrcU family type III secretion system export apparatus switch protein, partial [Candidatus Baltobacteraceae bacterium]